VVNVPFSFPFDTNSSNTTFSFSGYDVPAGVDVSNIGLFLNGTGANLLGAGWTLIPAANRKRRAALGWEAAITP
jgi:hypothetical protein